MVAQKTQSHQVCAGAQSIKTVLDMGYTLRLFVALHDFSDRKVLPCRGANQGDITIKKNGHRYYFFNSRSPEIDFLKLRKIRRRQWGVQKSKYRALTLIYNFKMPRNCFSELAGNWKGTAGCSQQQISGIDMVF